MNIKNSMTIAATVLGIGMALTGCEREPMKVRVDRVDPVNIATTLDESNRPIRKFFIDGYLQPLNEQRGFETYRVQSFQRFAREANQCASNAQLDEIARVMATLYGKGQTVEYGGTIPMSRPMPDYKGGAVPKIVDDTARCPT